MTKEEIKKSVPMREIAERYGIKVNRNGFCRCIFHNERTPSMKLYKDSFYCFSCQKSGDIFTFVQKMDGLSFKEAFSTLGGGYDNNFSSRLRIYQAQKKREMQQKTGEKLKNKRELTGLLMGVYRKGLDCLEPLSDAWADTYNALQYQEYLWEVLNDPNECYEVIKQLR